MQKKILTLLFLFTNIYFLQAQDFNWWKNNVNWDGHTYWFNYLTISSTHLGPNALSVPFINNGTTDSISSIGLTSNAHISNGDHTYNFMIYGNYCSKDRLINVDVNFVPYEYFNMSHEIKTFRKTYYTSYNVHNTVGDVVINTNIKLFPKLNEVWNKAIRIGLRMPSGGQQEMARYGDVPAYWIDLGGSHNLSKVIKASIAAGFMAWQTNDPDLRQDDAFTFGTGLDYFKHSHHLQFQITGYLGYKNNGDRPIVCRINYEKICKKFIYLARFEQGIHNFGYSSFEAGAKYVFTKKTH